MRTLQLREYEALDESLEPGEVTALLGLERRPVELAPTGVPGNYTLRAGCHVGTVVLPTLRLLIRPKVPLDNLFFLLGYASGRARWGNGRFPYAKEADLLEAVGWLFQDEVNQAARRGFPRAYRLQQEPLQTIRGRIAFSEQIRLRQGLALPLECRYEEYTEDTELNRILKAAHRRLLQLPVLDATLSLRLRRTLAHFSSAGDVSYPPGAVPSLALDRLSRHWEPALRLAELILRQEVVRDQQGETMGTTFLVNMNELFESFVTRVVDEEAAERGWLLEPQASRRLTERVWMRPDLVLRRLGADCAVGDVKYKELEIEGFRHADLYQLLAYCTALGLDQGLLIYAGEGASKVQVVQRAGIALEQVRVDLSGAREEVLANARWAAGRLVEQAESASADWARRAGRGSSFPSHPGGHVSSPTGSGRSVAACLNCNMPRQ